MEYYIQNLVNSQKDERFAKFLKILSEKDYFKGINDYKTLSERLEKAKTKFYSSKDQKPDQKITKPQKPIKKAQLKDLIQESSLTFQVVSYLGIATYSITRFILQIFYKFFSKRSNQ